MAKSKLTARAAIQKVLTDNGGKMKVPDIIKAAVPLTALSGKTPGQTIYSTLYAENKKPGGIFKQTGRGEFRLDKANVAKAEKAAAEKAEKPKQSTPRKPRSRKSDDEQTLAEAAAQDGDAPTEVPVEADEAAVPA